MNRQRCGKSLTVLYYFLPKQDEAQFYIVFVDVNGVYCCINSTGQCQKHKCCINKEVAGRWEGHKCSWEKIGYSNFYNIIYINITTMSLENYIKPFLFIITKS